MNTNSFESLAQLLASNTPVEQDLPIKNSLRTKALPDKNSIWDDDEIAEAVEVDPRPCPEYFFILITKAMI
jgi:hypothetical protein